MGFSQGGVMAYDLALGRPERFSALIALSTWLPNLILDGLQEDEARAKLAALLIHGTEDPMVAVDNGRESLEKLKGLGIEAAWGEYPMGHEINQHALRDLETKAPRTASRGSGRLVEVDSCSARRRRLPATIGEARQAEAKQQRGSRLRDRLHVEVGRERGGVAGRQVEADVEADRGQGRERH